MIAREIKDSFYNRLEEFGFRLMYVYGKVYEKEEEKGMSTEVTVFLYSHMNNKLTFINPLHKFLVDTASSWAVKGTDKILKIKSTTDRIEDDDSVTYASLTFKIKNK